MGAAWKIGAGVVVLAAGAAVTGMAVSGDGDDPRAAETDSTSAARNTADVSRRTLTQADELEGTIDFGDPRSLVLAPEGTITDVPSVGDVIANGDRVLEVNGQPVIALEGTFPFWRPLNNDMTDGKDVFQLELILAAMGYAEDADMTVDDEFTWETKEAVEAFQEDHGLDDDGDLGLGEVVVITEPVRVDSVGGTPGMPASAAEIKVTNPDRTVQIQVPVDEADLVDKGDRLDVELPSGNNIDGKVTRIGAATTDSDGNSVIPVSLTVSGVDDLADGTPVDVHLVTEQAKRVLAVPVEAVLALAEGGYAVEVPTAAGSTRLVPVELGMFADGWVEITGEIDEGAKVVVP